jgi:hypothetical protein
MDENFVNNKFITVAGRAASMEEFAAQIKKNLYDNYDIVAIHGLGELYVDDKERYLAFVTGESETGHNFDAQEKKLTSAQFGAHLHENLDEAFEYAKVNYPSFGEEEEAKQKKFKELTEKFPPLKAEENEQVNILESMWAAGHIRTIRCVLDDEPVVVVVALSGGSDEVRVRPLAIMINTDLEARLEFPNPNE